MHGLYVDKYGDDVVSFVVDKYDAATSGSGNGSSSSSATTTTIAPTASVTGSATTTSGEGAASETGNPDSMAAGLGAPGLGLLLTPIAMLRLWGL